MTQLLKATLTELTGDRTPTPAGPDVPVQFNPSSLHLSIANNVDGGKTATRPAEQYVGTGSATLTLDLVFDTADEGTTAVPVSVRTKTADVSKFVMPKPGGGKQSPPRVRFHWGDLIFEGVMTVYSEDIDLFAASGVPLRAKCSIGIQGQDPRYESLATGPGAAQGAGAALPGGLGLGLSGSAGISLGASVSLGADAQVGVALGGETAADFAARVGLDPAAWRSVDFGAQSSLALSAGAEVGFSAAAAGRAGLGVSVGVDAGGGSLAAAVNLPVGAPPAVGGVAPAAAPAATTFAAQAPPPVPAGRAGPAAAAGYALVAAGGVEAAVAQVLGGRSAAGAGAERAAFRAPVAAVPPPPPAASTPPALPDQRAVTFGSSVPLRPLVGGSAATRAVLGPRAAAAVPALTPDPTVAPWTVLPAAEPTRATADAAQARRTPLRPCGCGGPCAHTREVGV